MVVPVRVIGGGRVLGSPRPSSPAVTASPLRPPQASPPPESSASLESQRATSLPAPEPQDLVSQVFVDHGEPSAAPNPAAVPGSHLVCPICNEEMVTLLQLNRHLDDNHQNLEEVEQDEVKQWFKTQMNKAKKFQPLAVLNQKLKGLDVFESNDTPPPPAVHVPGPSHSPAPVQPAPPDPDDIVTKSHWQKPGNYDRCSEPTCGKPLGASNGRVNCRHCGKLFCEEHTMYQMKLSRSAQHEPVRGFWCRVCETCYKSREGYNDHTGLERNLTEDFAAVRRRTVDKATLEVSRLEKRMTRLTQLLANPPKDSAPTGSGRIWTLSSTRTQQRTLEQSIVTWEDDAKVIQCPFCQQEFNNYTFRRHHCRLCGRVVCGDPRTGCSTEVGLNVAPQSNGRNEKGGSTMSVDVRMCKVCKHTIFSKSDFARELAHRPADQRAYENLVQFERGIRLLLPKFQRLLMALQDPEKPPTSDQLQDATKVRKRLMDSFTQYDTAAKRIRDLPTTSPTQERLQKAIYVQATNFLHLHMLPMKTVPKLLKHATPHGAKSSPNSRPNGALAAIKYNDMETRSQAESSSQLSTMEAEEKELRERLIVLEEQKFFVTEMIADANKRRKFDEVSSLAQNMEDLSKEIDHINGMLGQMDFSGFYAGGMTSPAANG